MAKNNHYFVTNYSRGFPGGASRKEPAWKCRRHKWCELDLWVGKSPWRREWQSFQYSCLKYPMDRGAWWATVHKVAVSDRTEATWQAHVDSKFYSKQASPQK